MNVRERLLTIRLMEKLRDNGEYAKHLGLSVSLRENPSSGKQKEKSAK